MRKSYIANTAEALNLHNGNQTAIVAKMNRQPNKVMWNTVKTHPKTDWCDEHGNPLFPPYQIGQEVYVREAWCPCDTEDGNLGYAYKDDEYADKFVGWGSPVTMPKQASRTRFKIVGCEAVRVKDLGAFGYYIAQKLGNQAWDNNDYIWFYRIQNIKQS